VSVGVRRHAKGAVLVLVSLALLVVALRAIQDGPVDRTIGTVQLPAAAPSPPLSPNLATPTLEIGAAGLSHKQPPPLEQLRDYRQRQAIYDQEAKSGDFVTPPAVSIEH